MRRAIAVALLALPVLIGAALIVVSGIIPITASSGHWPITAWFLDFTKRRSVATHSIGVRAPLLDDPALVLKGGGHYDSGCRPCHGSPQQALPKIPARMTPHPPNLQQQLARWDPEELFYIVKHGIKFTGMPAWPAAPRDDEVWAVVAFLRALPRMDAEAYARLISGSPVDTSGDGAAGAADPAESSSAAQFAARSCARCHGIDGQGRENAAFPRLAGQPPDYLKLALQAYADGTRNSGIMAPIAAALDDNRMRDVARYYASLPPPAGSPGSAPRSRGAEIATRGIPAQEVPPCVECHGPTAPSRNPAYPRLSGQFADYLILQLHLLAEDRRGGSPYAHIMRGTAHRLSAEQAIDVAAYYASLTP